MPLPTRAERSARLRLRSLVLLRWLGVVGQSAAVLVAALGFGLDLPLGLCFAAIGAARFNLALSRRPGTRRLGETEATPVARLRPSPGRRAPLPDRRPRQSLRPFPSRPRHRRRLGREPARHLPARPRRLSDHDRPRGRRALAARLASGDTLTVPPLLVVGTWASLTIATFFLAIHARA